MNSQIEENLDRIRQAAFILGRASAQERTMALKRMAEALRENKEAVLAANEQDVMREKAAGLEKKRLGILTIASRDIDAMAGFFEQAASFKDPVGQVLEEDCSNGLHRSKRLFPVGVVGVVYEARPSVVTDCAALCIRSGNALLLRGSRHAVKTDRVLAEILKKALREAGLPGEAVMLVEGGGHALTCELAACERKLDLLIVRGGYGALEEIRRAATVPVIGAGPGNCHIYIDESAVPQMAEAVTVNSKVPRPLACNAAETLLVHEKWAEKNLPALLERLHDEGLELRGCPRTCRLSGYVKEACEEDWRFEYFAPVLAVKVVESLSEAIDHINRYRTPHTEVIITENEANTRRFMASVEANVVGWNVSTRLTDGAGFGMGGEMGISTQKYPYGGPIGMEHLMQQKYYLSGNGVLR